jgi:hypothetical protein
LDQILKEYLGRLERGGISSPTSGTQGDIPGAVRPLNLIIVTDGGRYLAPSQQGGADQ